LIFVYQSINQPHFIYLAAKLLDKMTYRYTDFVRQYIFPSLCHGITYQRIKHLTDMITADQSYANGSPGSNAYVLPSIRPTEYTQSFK